MLSDSGFDRVAGWYDQLAHLVFGHTLNRAQATYLDQIPPQATVLLVGGGSGWLLSQLLTHCHPDHVFYVEASARMLELAKQKAGQDARVTFIHGNEDSLTGVPSVDVVLTPFLLDLFGEERLRNRLLPALSNRLTPGGLWLCTDFSEATPFPNRALLRTMYLFFRFTAGIEARRLPDWQKLLETELGLKPQFRRSFRQGFIVSGGWRKPAA